MKISKSFRWVMIVSALLVMAGTCAAQSSDGQLLAPTTDVPLRVSIYLDQLATPSHPVFRVELQNSGQGSLLLNIGTMASGDNTEYPTAISLLLNGPGWNNSLRLEPARVSDAIPQQPLIVPLAPGATYSLPINLENYRVAGGPGDSMKVVSMIAGAYSIRAEFTGAVNGRTFFHAGFVNGGSLFTVGRSSAVPGQVPLTGQAFDAVITSNGSRISNTLRFEIAN